MLALCSLVACLALASTAWAAPQPARSAVAKSIHQAAVDGGHFVVWSKQGPDGAPGRPGRVVVLNDTTGSRKTVELGRACDSVSAPDGHEGRFVIACPFGLKTYTLILDAGSGKVTNVGDEHAADCYGYFRIGRHWLEGTSDCSGHQVVIYTNWHTGETRTDGDLLGDPRRPYNLDRPSLPASGPVSQFFRADGPRVLKWSQVTGSTGGTRELLHLLLPGRKPQQLLPCGRCMPLSLKAGLAVWKVFGDIRYEAYVIATRRRLHWRLADGAQVVGATAKRVYFTVPSKSNSLRRDLKTFRWP